MPLSGDLFEPVANAPVVPHGLPLVILLTGFTDAGGAVSGLIDHLQDVTDSQPLMVFDNDVLLDYRARRPIVVFEKDHLTEFRPSRLELALAHDALGQPFLLLSGYEPDFAWNAFSGAVLDMAESYGVSTVSWVHAIAMPIPHTRPIGASVSGNRKELIASVSVWQPRTQIPATAAHLLEYRFAEKGLPVAGFVLLIPHYLAETENPEAVLAAADRLMGATGLVLRMDDVEKKRDDYLDRVNEQVQANAELQQMVQTLEHRYDAYMAGHTVDGDDRFDDGFSERDIPSADELAAELERYLATRPPADDDKRGRS